MSKQYRYVRVTIADAYPVFYSHVSQRCNRANDPETEGPFYAPGSAFLHAFSEKKLAWAHRSAEALRANGYTVDVDVVLR